MRNTIYAILLPQGTDKGNFSLNEESYSNGAHCWKRKEQKVTAAVFALSKTQYLWSFRRDIHMEKMSALSCNAHDVAG